MPKIDYQVVFALQKQILKAPDLTPDRKIEMIENAIDESFDASKEKS